MNLINAKARTKTSPRVHIFDVTLVFERSIRNLDSEIENLERQGRALCHRVGEKKVRRRIKMNASVNQYQQMIPATFNR